MDDHLLKSILNRDQRAFKALFDDMYPLMCAHAIRIGANRALAEDIVQEVFIDFWHKAPKVKSSLSGYLKISVRNHLLNHWRKNKNLWQEVEDVHSVQYLNPHRIMEVQEHAKRVQNSIDALPNRCRIIFTLSRFEQMTYMEIATELDISIKTVENQISKALKLLRSSQIINK